MGLVPYHKVDAQQNPNPSFTYKSESLMVHVGLIRKSSCIHINVHDFIAQDEDVIGTLLYKQKK